MKKLVLLMLLMGSFAFSYAQTPFITIWKTDNNSSPTRVADPAIPVSTSAGIRIPVTGGTTAKFSGSYKKVGADESTRVTFTDVAPANSTDGYTFEFGTGNEGIYELVISAVSSNFNFQFANNSNRRGDRSKLLEIKQWGDVYTFKGGNIFSFCPNLQVTATDAPKLTGDIGAMFNNCIGLTGHTSFNSWNLENVTSINSLFLNASSFNQPLGNWDISHITNVADIFKGATLLSCVNFSKTLKGWADKTNTPLGLTLGELPAGLTYGDQTAYDNLTGSGTGQKGWTISNVSFDATCASVLPVNFLAINATLNGSNLLVQWQTASEQNNDYFSIYASEDGRTWQELGRVNSKAVNGNSNTVLGYEYSTAYSSTTVQLASISMLGVLALAFLAFNRRNRWLISATAVVCFGVFFSSCQKNELLGEQDATTAYSKQSNKAIYIKVMQTDKDGKTSESGIVVVNRK